MPSWMHVWGLPGRIALLLGVGALSVAGAKADTAGEASAGDNAARVPQQSAKTFGDLLIWSEADRIYASEAGQPAEELRFGDSTEAIALRQLLERSGATAARPHVLRDRIILVGGGGAGFSWQPPRQPNSATPAPAPTTGAAPGGDAGNVGSGTSGAGGSAVATAAPKS
jgi:hypothetical protein